MEEMHINWAAFAVAVVAQMVIGFLWFHPSVMGKMWAKANNIELKDMNPENAGMSYGITILLTIVFTFWLAGNVTGPGQQVAADGHSFVTFQHGLAHALALSIMVMLPVFSGPAIFEKRGWKWAVVHVGYWFARMAVAAGILSAWR